MQGLPNLVIIGVPKAGTTALFEYLEQHPAIDGSADKEPGFFMHLRDGREPRMTVDEYLALWPPATVQTRYRLEATARYAFGGPPLIEALGNTLPDPRLLLVLRDPVDRLWSAYWSQRYSRRFHRTLRRSLDLDVDRFLDRCTAVANGEVVPQPGDADWVAMRFLHSGRYGDWLPPWDQAFGDRLRILFFDDLRADPDGVTRDLFRWLDLDSGVDLDVTARNRTVTPRSELLHATAQWFRTLSGLHARAPRLNRALTGLYERVNTTRGAPRELDEPTRRRLRRLYADSNEALAGLLVARGVEPLPPWLQPAGPA